MNGQKGGWVKRAGGRFYSYSAGEDTVEIRVAHSNYEGSACLLVPLVIGARLLLEEQAKDDEQKREKEKAAAPQDVRKLDLREDNDDGVIRKSAFYQPDEADFYQDAPEAAKLSPLPPILAAAIRESSVPVFDHDQLVALKKRIATHENERAERMEFGREQAMRRGGLRSLPHDRQGITASLDELAEVFPNLGGAVEFLRCELAIAMAGEPHDFRVSPLLLVGEPGIGKTAFCRAVASVIGGRFEEFSAGGAQGGFDLCGSSAHWSTTTPGRVFQALAEGDSASPVFLIDEVDKVSGDDRFPVLPTLLNLTERDSAWRFRDECLQIQFDASKAVIVMTANDLSAVPAPLLSRVQVLEVPAPTTEQRRVIAGRMLAELPPVAVPSEALDRLAECDADLREVQRRLRRAVGDALARGLDEVAPDALGMGQWKRRAVGFVS